MKTWPIALAILVAAAAIVGVMLFTRSEDRKCEQWQAEVRNLAQVLEAPSGLVQDLPGRPEGCPLP